MSKFSVTLLMTEQCNLRCNYCYEKFLYKASSPVELSRINRFFEVLAREYDSIHVSFFGGEPTLAIKNIRKIIQCNNELDAVFTYSITSNGTMLSSDILAWLVDSGLKQIQVTLDGGELSHDVTRVTRRGAGTFAKIYQNILTYRHVNGDFVAVIRINASPSNQEEIPELTKLLVSDFEQDPRFRVFMRPVGKWGGENDAELKTLTRDDFQSLQSVFRSILPTGMEWDAEGAGICYAAMPNHLLVYPDGRLGKCTVGLHDDVNDIGRIDEAGHIHVDSRKFSFWSRGFVTNQKEELACPYWAKSTNEEASAL